MKLLFLGDSITDGNRIRDNDWDLNHQLGHSYVYLIAAALGASLWDQNLDFINRGISGDGVAGLLARLEKDAIAHRPDVITVLIGVNDAMRSVDEGSEKYLDKFENTYRMLLDEVYKALPACSVILCEPIILPVGQVKEKFNLWSDSMTRIQTSVKCIADDYSLLFVPLQGKFLELCSLREARYWLWDGIHPSVAGHQIIADEWMKAAGNAGILTDGLEEMRQKHVLG